MTDKHKPFYHLKSHSQNLQNILEWNRLDKKTITLGVCAVKKKVQSKPMREILSRIKCIQIQIILMWQYLQHHWSTWPKVDALICFYSQGFPYLMAWKYVRKHNPFLINSLQKQQLLWDRTVVYDILKKIKIPVAKHYYLTKDKNYLQNLQTKSFGKIIIDPNGISEVQHDDQLQNERKSKSKSKQIQINQQQQKVQQNQSDRKIKFQQDDEQNLKGSRELFQLKKLQSRLSKYSSIQQQKKYPSLLRQFIDNRPVQNNNQIQIQQSQDYILIKQGEQITKLSKPFVEKPFDSQNHQICVYYPASMGGGRKKLFRKVKDCSSQYQNNQNSIRKDGNYIYQQFLATNAFDIKVYTIGAFYMYAQARRSPTLDGVVQRNSDGKQVRYPVILTPQQKFICYKIVKQFQQQVCGFDLLRSNGKSYVCDVNGWSFVKSNPKYWEDCSKILKKKIFNNFFPQKVKQNQKFEQFLHKYQKIQDKLHLQRLTFSMKQQLRSIVSIFRHGDRSPKLKLKIKTKDKRFIQFFKLTNKDQLKFKDPVNLTKILQITVSMIAQMQKKDPSLKDYLQMKFVLQSGGHFQGFTRKLQLKVIERNQQTKQIKKIMIVLKWGGQLSYMGYMDAIQLGKKMRMQRYDDNDLLSLYSSYRHDLKTYSSDQGRCIKTAAAFLKGFLSIQGELAPIISSMVKADLKAQRKVKYKLGFLDCTSQQNHSTLADQLQQRLTEIMNSQQSLYDSFCKYAKKDEISNAMLQTIKNIQMPRLKLQQVIDDGFSYMKKQMIQSLRYKEYMNKVGNNKDQVSVQVIISI